MKRMGSRLLILAILFFGIASCAMAALEISRSSPSPLRYPRLFVREQIEGNALFSVHIDAEGKSPSIDVLDTTNPRIVEHSKSLLSEQTWRLAGDVSYPVEFEVTCTYHYVTKRLQIWIDPVVSGGPEVVPFNELSGKPIPQVKIELTVPQGEEQQPIVLKIPVSISKMGRIAFKHPEKRDSTAFHSSAYQVLDRLIFTPPILNGRPVNTEVILPVVFKPGL